MIDAGLPLVQCLDILGMQQENEAFKKIILRVKEDVEAGSTFADALKKHPKAFDDLFVNLVAAGEVGGILDTIEIAPTVRELDGLALSSRNTYLDADQRRSALALSRTLRVVEQAWRGGEADPAAVMRRGVIEREERYLERKFGAGVHFLAPLREISTSSTASTIA